MQVLNTRKKCLTKSFLFQKEINILSINFTRHLQLSYLPANQNNESIKLVPMSVRGA